MENAPSENAPALTSRRDLLKLATATGAGILLGAASSTVKAASTAAVPGEPGFPVPSHQPYKFKLSELKPTVDNQGGSVAECDKRNFPIVEQGGAAVFLLKLKPGGLREPHWHPNCWEMDYVVSGRVQMTIVPPSGPPDIFTLEAGDVAFVPQGFAHSIINIGDVEAVIPIVFNDSLPTDIGLSTMYSEFPTGQFTQTLGVPESAMANIPKPKSTLVVVPKPPGK